MGYHIQDCHYLCVALAESGTYKLLQHIMVASPHFFLGKVHAAMFCCMHLTEQQYQ